VDYFLPDPGLMECSLYSIILSLIACHLYTMDK
jgi:hypothetical protein